MGVSQAISHPVSLMPAVMRAVTLSSLIICSLVPTTTMALSADEWRQKSIYQIMTDRFALTNDNGTQCDTSARKYCGGTWRGIINHLDYVQNMGFDAIWISPVAANIEGNTTEGEAFHGYWTKDMTNINSHFGTSDDLKELSETLHKRGMYLMFDVVLNHMAAPTLKNFDFNNFFQPFPDESFFHKQCWVGNSTDQNTVEQCWLGDENLPLPDLNTDNQTVVDTLKKVVTDLVSTYNVDGLRLDTVKHINRSFWKDFRQSVDIFMMGEVLTNETSFAVPYTEDIDAILDYPGWFPLIQAFATTQGQMSTLANAMTDAQQAYDNGLFNSASFIENHDQPRFASYNKDDALVHNVMMFPFIHDGFPIVYYGSEQGYQGGSDPYNREALWLSAYETEKPLVGLFKTLNAARKQAISTTLDGYNYSYTPMKFLAVEDHTVAISKPPMLGLFTNVGSQSSETATWTVTDTGFKPNEALIDVLTCSKLSVDASGTVHAESYYGMPQLLMPVSALEKGGAICPDLATGTRTETTSASRSLHGAKGARAALSTALLGASAGFFMAGLTNLV